MTESKIKVSSKSTGNILLTILAIIILSPIQVFAWLNWKTLETDKFQIIYKQGYELPAEECLKILEYYRDDVVDITGHNSGKIPVVIEDFGMMTNGYADYIFKNIHLSTYPAESSSEIGFCENWWRMAGIHEYTHIAHLTYTGGLPKVFTTILGTVFQPNIWSPFWLMEGMAVFSESQISPYEGRLNDGFFDAYIAACASQRKFPSLLDITYSPFEYPYLNIRYIYGAKFSQFLAERYGGEKFADLFKDSGSSILTYFSPVFPVFGLDLSVSSIYLGRAFPGLYSEWQYYEIEKNKDWHIDGKKMTEKGGVVKFLICNNNKLYYVRETMIKTGAAKAFGFTEIIENDLNTKREKTVVSLTTYITCPLKIHNNKLYYSAMDMKRGYANTSYLSFGFYNNLHEKDLKTGKDRIIFKEKFRCFAVLEDGKILYATDKEQGFGSVLYLYLLKDKSHEKILETDLLIGELDVSNEYIIVSANGDWENRNIYLFDFKSKSFTPIISTPYKESGVCLSDNKVFFVANYDKIYTCFAYDLTTKTFYKITDGGYVTFPAYNKFDSTLYFVGIDPEGNDLYNKKIDFAIPFIPKAYPNNEQPELLKLEKEIKGGSYLNEIKTALPAIHIPFILPVDTTFRSWAVGGFLIGRDAIGEHNYSISFSVPPSSYGKPFFAGNYSSLFFSPVLVSLEYNNSLSYSFFDISYPFFIRPDARFSSLWTSVGGMVFASDFTRKACYFCLNPAFTFPKTKISSTIGYIFERDFFHSNINRNGVVILANIRRYIKNSEIGISVDGFSDPDNPDSIGPMIRGYSDPLYAKSGVSIIVEYSFPLIKIRKGLWNPNLYIEDLCLSFFYDFAYAYNNDFYHFYTGKRRFFIGTETKLEISFMFADYLRIIPVFGAGINRERDIKLYLGIEMGSWSQAGLYSKQKMPDFIMGKRRLKCVQNQFYF